MFIYSVRAGKLRLVALLLLSVAVIAALVILIPTYDVTTVFAENGRVVYTGAKNNEGRVDFLRQFGWEVAPEPTETVTVTVPEEFDAVFQGYNDLQQAQGLELSRYRKKALTRYTYTVLNYPNYEGTVYATLLIYRGKVVGGDICSAEAEGFIHGFLAPNKG